MMLELSEALYRPSLLAWGVCRLNLLLVGSFLERLHTRVSLQTSGSGIPTLAPTALQGIPFIELPLVSFFAYESSRSVEETARFRLSGIAVVGFLCALERRQHSSLHLSGGPYTSILGYFCTQPVSS